MSIGKHAAAKHADITRDILLSKQTKTLLGIRFSNPAQVRSRGVVRAVIKTRTRRRVLLWIRFKDRNGLAETSDVFAIAIHQQTNHSVLSRNTMFMLQLQLITEMLAKPKIDR